METQLRYLTTGITGIPCDSGGPVWQLNSDTSATIVGIWIGDHTNPDGTHNGVFISLVDVMAQLEIDSATNS
jgi:streptogrisin B